MIYNSIDIDKILSVPTPSGLKVKYSDNNAIGNKLLHDAFNFFSIAISID